MQYLTATAHARAGQQAGRWRPMPIGPAGLPIPAARALFSKSMNTDLLNKLARAAFAAYRAERLPAADEAFAAELLRAALVDRFPQADMAVLARYGVAQLREQTHVQMITPLMSAAYQIRFSEPIWTPAGTPVGFHIDLGGQESAVGAPVPDAAAPFLRAVHAVRQAQKRDFDGAAWWTGQFRTKEGRWPRWSEIEAQFVGLGRWMAEQRAASGVSTPTLKGEGRHG